MNLDFLIQRLTGRNADYLIQRMMGRATCRLGDGQRSDQREDQEYPRRSRQDRHRPHRAGSSGELMTFAHGGEIKIGEWCYVGEGTRIWSAGSIEIGNRVLISHSANIFDSLTHPIGAAARHAQVRQIFTSGHPRELSLDESPVRICDDAWIGAGAMVLRGVTVGQGAVVAAGRRRDQGRAGLLDRGRKSGCAGQGAPVR